MTSGVTVVKGQFYGYFVISARPGALRKGEELRGLFIFS